MIPLPVKALALITAIFYIRFLRDYFEKNPPF